MSPVVIDARDALAPNPRGWARYTRELIGALRRLGGDGPELRFVEQGGAGPDALFEQVALPRLLRRERAAAVHGPNCFLPLRRPCPGVVTVHDLAFETHPEDFSRRTGAKYRTLGRRSIRSAERVICDASFTRDDLCARYGVEPERVRVIPLAAALPLGSEQPPDGPYLLAVGDLRKKKNLGRLVEAFRRLRAEGLEHRLVIAGLDTGEGAALAGVAGDAPVELTGYVPDARLDALLRGAQALAYPSLHEGFGLPLLEAMARGCPVAAAAATVLPETGGDAALYFDPLDVGDIAATLGRVLGDAELRADLSARGRAHAASFSWDSTAAATAAVYRELL